MRKIFAHRNLTMKDIFISYIILITIWSVRIYIINDIWQPDLDLWSKAILNGSVKSIIWIMFAVFYLKRYNNELCMPSNQLFDIKINWKYFFIVLLPFLAVQFGSMFFKYGGFHIGESFHPSKLIGQFLIVGILEELVFRGWFFNALASLVNDTKANIIQSLLFMGIHFPSYIDHGLFTFPRILSISVFLFAMGMIFGWVFRKSKSLWPPIILHMIWDLLAITINGM